MTRFEWAAHGFGILESIAVVMAAVIALNEWGLHNRAEEQQKRAAVYDLTKTAVTAQYVSDAFYALYNERNTLLGLSELKFENKTGALFGYFWAIGVCVSSDLCDKRLALASFCDDYKVYRALLKKK